MQTNNNQPPAEQPKPTPTPLEPWSDEQLRCDAQATADTIADARADALRSNPELAALLEAKAVKR